MKTHTKTVLAVVGVMIGIVTGERSLYASEIAVMMLVLTFAQMVVRWFETRKEKGESSERTSERYSLTLLTILFSCGIFLGIIRVQLVEEKKVFLCETVCTFDAVIVSSPDKKGIYQQFSVHPIEGGEETLDVHVRIALYPSYQIGETLRIEGKVMVPKIIPPHGEKKSFDYAAYLLTRNIGSEMMYPKVEVIDTASHTFTHTLGRWKEDLVKRIDMYVSSPAQSLASGMLFGANSMSQELTQTFRTVGLSHIIVLSGFNIMIVIASVLFVLRFVPLVLRIVIATCSVVMFVMMVGGEVSVLRATAMAFVGLLATLVGREYVAKQALVLSLLAIVMYEPYALLHDVSLHLSFLATAGLVYMSAPLQVLCVRIKNITLRDVCTTTLAAYLATLPYIMYTFGTVSVYALLANIVVLPLVPLAMLLSFLVVVCSYVSHSLALVFGFIDSLFLNLILYVARVVEQLPFASFPLTISFLGMCALYLGIIIFVVHLYKKFSRSTVEKSLSKQDETIGTRKNEILSDVIPY